MIGGIRNQVPTHYPDLNASESKKDEKWHKEYAMAILQECQFSSLEYDLMDESFKYYNSQQTGEEFLYLQESEDGSALPAKWIDYNRINPKINLLAGELTKRSYELTVRALNKDARTRRLEKQNEITVKMRLQPYLQELQQGTGLSLAEESVSLTPGMQSEEVPMPRNNDDIKIIMRDNYKDISEICIKRLLDYFTEKLNWQTKRVEMFINIPITARCVAKVECINGVPSFRKVDPRHFIFDHNCEGDFLDNAHYVGEVRYVPHHEAVTKWNIKPETLEKLRKSRSVYNYGTRQYNYAININNETHYLVAHVEWMDTKPKKYKEKKDQYDNQHIKEVDPDYSLPKDAKEEKSGVYLRPNGEKVYSKRIRTVRYATLIGDEVVEWGELENQVRSIDDLSETGFSYVAFLPYWVDSTNVSIVQLIKGLQDLKNIAMYNLQLAMARAGAKGFMYDVSKLPPNMELEQVIHYIKAAGIGFYNGAQEGVMNPNLASAHMREFDQTISDSVNQYLNIVVNIDQQMDQMTGVNEARQGIVNNPSQAVGVTQVSLVQSSMQTQYIYDGFNKFSEKLFTRLMNSFKVAVTREDIIEHYSAILGDAAMIFVESDRDLALDDYGVFVEMLPDIIADRQKFDAMIMQALQSNAVNYIDALDLMMEKDLKLGLRRFKHKLIEREKMMMEAEQQKAREAQMAQIAQTQMQGQTQMGIAEMNNRGKLMGTMMQGQQRAQQAQNQDQSRQRMELLRMAQQMGQGG